MARARAYEAGGAAAISVLCEPHWFGGSVDDLRAVRAAVSIPVLAKEFVVEPIQLPHLRAAGADFVLLLAVLHPKRELAALVDRALEIGLEPLVEAHDERELERALATSARLIGLNNRDLRTLEVDTERAVRLRALVPDDRIVVAESGVRDAATVAGWRAVGFDAALVGEALVRSPDPRAAVAAFVEAGREPADLANEAARPFVKICGVTDADGILAAVRAGADAIGLNLVPGTPRELALDEAVELRRVVRALAPGGRAPLVVAITADAGEERIAEIVGCARPGRGAALRRRAAGADRRGSAGRPGRRSTCPRRIRATSRRPRHASSSLGGEHLAAGATRLLLDTAGGPHPGGTGTRAAPPLVAAVARELPVTLAGGLVAGIGRRGRARRLPSSGSTSHRASSGRGRRASALRRTPSRSRCS